MLGKIFFSILFLLVVTQLTNAQVPQLINYQGVLTDAQGNPVDGTQSVQFSIYDSATEGDELWTETQSVIISDGLFHVLLGSVTPIPYLVFQDSTTYLELTIGSDPAMTPRQRLVSVGYSMSAYNTDKLDGKDASAFVQKVSGVTPNQAGGINLAAGDNVTIVPDNDDNKITISASGGSSGDNLGNHTADSNINLNGYWLSGDGENEGIWVGRTGRVGIGSDNIGHRFQVMGDVYVDDDMIVNKRFFCSGLIRVGYSSHINGDGDISAADDIRADGGIAAGELDHYSWNNEEIYAGSNLKADGNLYVHGTKSSTMETVNYGTRCFYADESAGVYFKDRGQGKLINGEAVIEIDPIYQQAVTINDENPLLVQLTLTGDCNGVFVSEKNSSSFKVKELMGGSSNATFDWEITAKRKHYESVRLEMISKD